MAVQKNYVISGASDGPLPLTCFGEIGLTGELRSVAHGERRLAEAAKFGLGPVVEPGAQPTLREALRAAFGGVAVQRAAA